MAGKIVGCLILRGERALYYVKYGIMPSQICSTKDVLQPSSLHSHPVEIVVNLAKPLLVRVLHLEASFPAQLPGGVGGGVKGIVRSEVWGIAFVSLDQQDEPKGQDNPKPT